MNNSDLPPWGLGDKRWLSWEAPAYGNNISTSNSNTLSYKTIKLAYEYLTSGAAENSWIKPDNVDTWVFPDFKMMEKVPFYTPTPRQPLVPVMPEQLT